MSRVEVRALDPRERISGGLAAVLIVEILVASALSVLILMVPDVPRVLQPVLWFLSARIVGDLFKAFAGRSVLGMAVDGHAKAAGWALLVAGGAAMTLSQPLSSPPWPIGLALALSGVSLWGHHVQAETVSVRLAKQEGTLGACLSTAGAPLAVTMLPLSGTWELLAPILALVVIGALAARGVVRLLGRRSDASTTRPTGWGAWYQDHFFRLTFLVAATIGYLFVRATLATEIPLLFIFEYGAAVIALGMVLWTLRNHLSKRLQEDPLQSPHHRHEQRLERQGESSFDRVEDAFGRFLDDGDPEAVRALVSDLHASGIDAEATLAPLTRYQRSDRLLLVHPGWLYAARLMAVVLVAWGARLFVAGISDDPLLPGVVFLFVVAAGLYGAQWNSFGGPWAAKTGVGYAGLALVLIAEGRIAAGTSGPGLVPLLLSSTVGIVVGLVVLLLPLVHPWRAARGKPLPRYGYRGSQPLLAIDRLRVNAESGLVRRALWIGGIGVLVFFLAGELSRLAPSLAVLFPMYLLFGAMLMLQPISVSVGLRLGAAQVQRLHERERAQRLALFTAAGRLLDASFARQPRRFGPAAWNDPTETG